MSRHREFDLGAIAPQAFAERPSKVRTGDFAAPPEPGASFAQFLAGLPGILAGPQVAEVAAAVVAARRAGRAVVVALGGHVIKTGLAPVLADLARRGLVTAFCVNGAVTIHDAEIALFGATSENVDDGLRSGTFGMARETAEFHADAVRAAAAEGLGLGESVGRALQGSPHAAQSLLAEAYRLGVPVTVHVALGTDIVHCHPALDGAAAGEATMRDFRILVEQVRGLANGGVVMNIGSAVVLPEVLLKAFAVLRNTEGAAFTDFLGVNLDFMQQYRSTQQVVARVTAIGGRGIALTGHHEILVPLVAQAIVEAAG